MNGIGINYLKVEGFFKAFIQPPVPMMAERVKEGAAEVFEKSNWIIA